MESYAYFHPYVVAGLFCVACASVIIVTRIVVDAIGFTVRTTHPDYLRNLTKTEAKDGN